MGLSGWDRKGQNRKILLKIMPGCILKLTVSHLTIIIEYSAKTKVLIVISETGYGMAAILYFVPKFLSM